MNKPIVMNCHIYDEDCPTSSNKAVLQTMASILGRIISPKPAAFGSILLGSWAYGAAAGARHLSAEVGGVIWNLDEVCQPSVVLIHPQGCTLASCIL